MGTPTESKFRKNKQTAKPYSKGIPMNSVLHNEQVDAVVRFNLHLSKKGFLQWRTVHADLSI